MYWLIFVIVVVFILFRQFVRTFFRYLLDRFSAWDSDRNAKITLLNSEIIDRTKELFASMAEVIEKIDGPVLELGCGSGPNVKYYPPKSRLMTCDLNDHFKPYLMENLEKTDVKLEKYLIGDVQDMSDLIPDSSCSCVVSSLLLCCVDQEKVLREIMRVLKPGGRFYFIEHLIEQPGTLIRLIQIAMTPIWSRIRFNCHLTRNTDIVIEKFGFDNLNASIWYRPLASKYFFSKRTFIGFGDKSM